MLAPAQTERADVLEIVSIPEVPTRERIEQLEDEIAAACADGRMTRVQFKTTHYFWEEHGRRFYGREIVIPEGALLTGAVHRFGGVEAIPRGKIRVGTAEGVRTITGPCSFISPPGAKRAGLALEETVWLTIRENPTGREDPEEMERLLVEPARPELLEKLEKLPWLSH